MAVDRDQYCREIETFLCRKNDGHLIRVVGPSFELVSSWAERGVPLKVVFSGIDRAFERYHRKGPRRRPIKIDFCEADVLDVFDEWRRAVGIAAAHAEPDNGAAATRRGPSLPEHLERALVKLSAARASGALGESFDPLLDAVSTMLDHARAHAGGLRGDRRAELLNRLAGLDADLVRLAERSLDDRSRTAISREAEEELAPFRSRMDSDAFDRARRAAVERLVRDRAGLPTLTLQV